jgi:hypothetical protein
MLLCGDIKKVAEREQTCHWNWEKWQIENKLASVKWQTGVPSAKKHNF